MGERLGKEMSDLQFYTMQDGGRSFSYPSIHKHHSFTSYCLGKEKEA